jgi:hypothetical protein
VADFIPFILVEAISDFDLLITKYECSIESGAEFVKFVNQIRFSGFFIFTGITPFFATIECEWFQVAISESEIVGAVNSIKFFASVPQRKACAFEVGFQSAETVSLRPTA